MPPLVEMIINAGEVIYALIEVACMRAAALMVMLCDFCIWALKIYRSFFEDLSSDVRPLADGITFRGHQRALVFVQMVKHYVSPLYYLSSLIVSNIIWVVLCILCEDPKSAMNIFIAFYDRTWIHLYMFTILVGFCKGLYVLYCLKSKYPARENSKNKLLFTRTISELSRSERRHYYHMCLAYFIIFWCFW